MDSNVPEISIPIAACDPRRNHAWSLLSLVDEFQMALLWRSFQFPALCINTSWGSNNFSKLASRQRINHHLSTTSDHKVLSRTFASVLTAPSTFTIPSNWNAIKKPRFHLVYLCRLVLRHIIIITTPSWIKCSKHYFATHPPSYDTPPPPPPSSDPTCIAEPSSLPQFYSPARSRRLLSLPGLMLPSLHSPLRPSPCARLRSICILLLQPHHLRTARSCLFVPCRQDLY